MRNPAPKLPSEEWIACDILHDIEAEEVRRFARHQYLTSEEREVRDTLLDLLAPNLPGIVDEYRELNRALDNAARSRCAASGDDRTWNW